MTGLSTKAVESAPALQPAAAQEESRSARKGLLGDRQVAGLRVLVPVFVLVGVILAITIVDPRFLSGRSLSSAAGDAAPMLLLVLGSTPVILIGGIDLSIASLASLSSVLAALWLPHLGSLGFVAVVATACVLGAGQGFVQGKAQVPSFVVTLGGLGVFSGAALYLSGASTLAIDGDYPLLDWEGALTFGVPNSVLTVVLICAVLAAIFHVTPLGRWIYATGAGEAAAMLCGVRTERVRIIVFALSGGCAALASMLLIAQTDFSAPTLADNLLLPTITGVVIGGTSISGGVGGLWSGLAGGLTVAAVRVGTVVLGFGPALQGILFGSGIILAVALTTDRRKIGIIK